MAVWKVAPALAAGCSAVLKPSEMASLSCLKLAELVHDAGVPPGVFNVVTGLGAEAGAALAAHDGIDKVRSCCPNRNLPRHPTLLWSAEPRLWPAPALLHAWESGGGGRWRSRAAWRRARR